MKRKLSLLNEVLPAPQQVTTSPVRARTLARLKVLAAFGAAALAASCRGGANAIGGEAGDGGPDGGGKALPDGGIDGGEQGYGVVDPLPPPSCFDVQPSGTGRYVDAEDLDGGADAGLEVMADGGAKAQLVEVELTFPVLGTFIGDFRADDGTELVSLEPTPTGAKLLVRIPANVHRSSQFAVTVSCTTGPGAIAIIIDRAAGTPNIYVR